MITTMVPERPTPVAAKPPRGERALRVVGVASLVGIVFTIWLGLWVTPPDQFMGNWVRLLYVHPPMAWVAFLAYGLSFLASLAYLDRLRLRSAPPAADTGGAWDVAAQIRRHGVTHLQCTPSLARLLASSERTLAALAPLRKLLLGGDPSGASLFLLFFA